MISYTIIRKPSRKTASVQVSPSNQVSIIVPPDLTEERIAAIIKSKTSWIINKIAINNQVKYPVRAKEFISGEAFAYLGRNYRLKVLKGIPGVELKQGCFIVRVPDKGDNGAPALIRELLIEWYIGHAGIKLKERVQRHAKVMGVKHSGLNVKSLTSQWGGCGKDGALSFNWRIIMAPLRLVDYVVIHELCHITYHDHSREFWLLLERYLPEWKELKEELRQTGALLVM
jgi:predicted metal-dependent hydrolase